VTDSTWWTRRRGSVGAPPSPTSTRKTPSPRAYSTVRVPPSLPEAVWSTALVTASLVSSAATSPAGVSRPSAATMKRRAAATWSGRPGKTR